MREGDLQRLVPVWFQIIYLYQSNNYDLSVRAFDVMGAFSGKINLNHLFVQIKLTLFRLD
jgi:hypothetical protein